MAGVCSGVGQLVDGCMSPFCKSLTLGSQATNYQEGREPQRVGFHLHFNHWMRRLLGRSPTFRYPPTHSLDVRLGPLKNPSHPAQVPSRDFLPGDALGGARPGCTLKRLASLASTAPGLVVDGQRNGFWMIRGLGWERREIDQRCVGEKATC